MIVSAILKGKGNAVVTARPTESLQAISKLLVKHRIGAVIICETAGPPLGILSERDIVNAVAASGATGLERPASEAMTRNLLTCEPGNSVDELMTIMTNSRVRHLPVVEQGQLVGIVSIGDVVKCKLDEASAEVGLLRDYVMAGR
ncbi:MAG TPA: CBS domain-containing protein [Candidatus Udaeobacter sp.]|nr:CBS domain-containing protein [Candidatus Udaeobacter sp.]